MSKKEKPTTNWIKITAFIVFIVAGMYFIPFFVINKSGQKAMCYLRGYKWLNFGMGPTGCYQTYPDGGKACTSGDECISKTCFVSGLYLNGKKRPMDNLVGTCPSLGPAYSESSTLCGSAKIENGKVVEDMRSCMY